MRPSGPHLLTPNSSKTTTFSEHSLYPSTFFSALPTPSPPPLNAPIHAYFLSAPPHTEFVLDDVVKIHREDEVADPQRDESPVDVIERHHAVEGHVPARAHRFEFEYEILRDEDLGFEK